MTYPAALLVHTANLETSQTAGTANAWVTPSTPVYTAIACRFGNSRTSLQNTVASGDRVVKTPVCIVPAGTAAVEGRLLVGTTAPFTKTYCIKSVDPAMVASSVSHLVLNLEAVE